MRSSCAAGRHEALVDQAIAERGAELLHAAHRGLGHADRLLQEPEQRRRLVVVDPADAELVHQPPGGGRPHPFRQLQHAEPAHLVERVLQHPQQRQRVLHVRGLQELQPAVLHERDVAPRQLHLEQVRVMRRAEQHGLLLERHALLAMPQHAPAHEVALLGLVQARAEHRHPRALARGPERLLVALRRERDGGVRRGEDRRDRAVVLLQADHGGAVEPASGTPGCCARSRRGTRRSTARRRRPP